MFTRSGATWTPQAAPVGTGASGGAYFGYAVGLSTDGNTAVVGGPTDVGNLGSVWTFARSGSSWLQQGAKLNGSGETDDGFLGSSVASSADGSTVLTGGPSDNNSNGAAWVFAAPPGAVPAAPTDVAATPGSSQASVSFTASSGTVSSYRVVAVPGGASATGTASPIVVPGLNNGTSYSFRVIAANENGTGPASAASNAVKPGTPTKPTGVVAVAADESAQLSWVAPASNNGSAITGYVVTPYIDAVAQAPVAVGAVTSTTLTGLTNGTSYTFTVTAVNAVGQGVASAPSNPVTPAIPRVAVPDAPATGPRPAVPDVTAGGGVRPPLPGG